METPLEHILTHAYKPGMIEFMDKHPEHFEELVNLSLSDKEPYCWRAAWLMFDCMVENDARIRPYINALIETAPNKKDGHSREIMRVLLKMELNDEQEGIMFNMCVDVWEKIGKKPSVRYIAFKYIAKLANKYPELKQEIRYLTQGQYLDTLSPGIKHSISNMVKD